MEKVGPSRSEPEPRGKMKTPHHSEFGGGRRSSAGRMTAVGQDGCFSDRGPSLSPSPPILGSRFQGVWHYRTQTRLNGGAPHAQGRRQHGTARGKLRNSSTQGHLKVDRSSGMRPSACVRARAHAQRTHHHGATMSRMTSSQPPSDHYWRGFQRIRGDPTKNRREQILQEGDGLHKAGDVL